MVVQYISDDKHKLFEWIAVGAALIVSIIAIGLGGAAFSAVKYYWDNVGKARAEDKMKKQFSLVGET